MILRNIFVIFAMSIPTWTFAQSLALSTEEREAYERYEAEISVPAGFLAADAFASIQADYTVNPQDAKRIRTLCAQMETHKYVHNYLLETAQERLANKRRIESAYWDSISALLIPTNPDMAGEFVGHAVKLMNDWEVTDTAEARLMDNAIRLARRRKETPCLSFAREEMDSLKAILSKGQIENTLYSKNAQQINAKVETIWQMLAAEGITYSLDKNDNLKKAATFYMKEQFVKDYYIDEPDLIASNLDDLYRHKPRIVSMYEGLKQKESVRSRHNDRVEATFSW